MIPRSILVAAAVSVIAAGSAFGRGAPPGVGGPPPGVAIGPPPAATAHIPNGVSVGPPAGVTAGPPSSIPVGPPSGIPGNAVGPSNQGAVANAAIVLGGLNAAHANQNALMHANPDSMVGDIATYEQQMQSALALTDPTQQANAITAARQQLASTTNKTLTASAVTQLDQMLGIKGASPSLGTSP
jgi:hypothetical protein